MFLNVALASPIVFDIITLASINNLFYFKPAKKQNTNEVSKLRMRLVTKSCICNRCFDTQFPSSLFSWLRRRNLCAFEQSVTEFEPILNSMFL